MKNKFIGGGSLRHAAVLVFWLTVWQIASILVGYDLLLPSPVQALLRLKELVVTSAFWQSVLYTACRIFMGFFAAFLTALVLAVLSGVCKTFRTL